MHPLRSPERIIWWVGHWIIDGFLSGLKAAWDAVTSWVKAAASSIPAIFKLITGIGSPSKVFHDIGLNIMEGLNNGLKAGVNGVMGTMNGLSGSMKGSLGLSGVGALGGVGGSTLVSSGSGPVSLTLHIHNNSGTVGELQSVVRREFSTLVTALRAGRR